ncbi:MAG: type IV secretion system DNA-binding domain-containing protein [Patescibacteria group bacterium]|nr:type IV secretion system DNA-binding domain-containing protein [Patescibacteria group bacterium]
MFFFLFYILPFLVIVVGGIGIFLLRRKINRKKFLEILDLKLFLIRLPIRSTDGKDLKQEINITEQLLSSLASFKRPFIFEIAVPHIGEEIHFYAAVPNELSEPFVRQVQSLWNDAEVKFVDDYNIFNYIGVTNGVFIKQKERFIIPIRTYQEVGSDTFSPILGGFSQLDEIGEGAAMQIIVKPAGESFRKEIFGALQVLKKGWKLRDVLNNKMSASISDFSEAISSHKKKGDETQKIIDEPAVKALEAKVAKPLFEINVRVLTSAADQAHANSILNGIAAGFSQFSAPMRNELLAVKPKNIKNLVFEFCFRKFNKDEAMIMTSEELVSLFHFPTPFTSIPRVKYLKAKEASPPMNLPEIGVLLGQSVFRGQAKNVLMADDDRRRHLYVVGQTGTGKTVLLKNIAVHDIRAGKGIAIIDPHGEFVNDVLGLVPKNRLEDVIVFDPSDLERPLGLNMLEYDFEKPEQKTFIINEMIGIFDKLYDLKITGGPMFEQYMRNALLLLMEDAPNESATLTEIPRVFTDVTFRERKLKRIHNPLVIDFWTKEATRVTGEASLANMTTYVGSKFNVFLNNDYVRPIIGQAKSAFNFRKIMDEGKILLVNLSKGKIGDLNAGLLGMVVTGRLLMAALSRTDLQEINRRDFYLYIDEFQNFTTDSISTILSEARKYRLNLVITHQFIAQLAEKIRDAVFGNVGSMVSFRVGAQDADVLVKQFEPVFNVHDLVNIDNFNAYAKLLMRGETTKPFNIKTIKPETPDLKTAMDIKNLSRLKYGRDRNEVEEEIYKRLRE